ncbi:MAG: hypothetical protein VW644_03440 [Alphaproteobacteria bacterium]
MENYRAWQTIGETYGFVFGNLGALAKVALLPLVFDMAVILGAQEMAQHDVMPGMMDFATFLLVWIVQMAFYVTFAIAWHRHYLIGPGEAGIFVTLRWHRRHWRFAIKAILLGLCILFIGFIVGMISWQIIGPMIIGPDLFSGGLYKLLAVQTAISLVFYYFLSRFLLAFPPAAVDDTEVGLGLSWDLTGGHSFKFFLVLIVAIGPLYAIEIAGSIFGAHFIAPEEMPGESVILMIALLTQILTFIGLALSTTAASITYRKLDAIDRAAGAASNASAPPDAPT